MKMREIKFRGKSLETGEWVYGDLLTHEGKSFNGVVIRDWGAKVQYYVQYYDIDLETVGQYTGLKDKNGREIYEGDIVTGLFNRTDIVGHIIYGSDATFFIKRKGLYGIGLNNAEDWLEVVGNIYENPELLEVNYMQKIRGGVGK
jgi:uncharacterized phage protein (TIGR01671 family)